MEVCMTQTQRIYTSEAADSSKDLSKVAKQAAHDIRSPLSALNILSRTCLMDMPEEARELMAAAIQRINEIANDLLNTPSPTVEPEASGCVVEQIEQIIEEKRLVYKDVQIEFVSHSNEANISCDLPKADLQRIVSNLLNNAIEASEDRKGPITVEVKVYPFFIDIVIEDKGKGIPQQILAEIGQEGFSFDKKGTGLGVFHAKSMLLSLGGEFDVASAVKVGTKVSMRIPKAHK
jgi:signal transduction histidine kinase